MLVNLSEIRKGSIFSRMSAGGVLLGDVDVDDVDVDVVGGLRHCFLADMGSWAHCSWSTLRRSVTTC